MKNEVRVRADKALRIRNPKKGVKNLCDECLLKDNGCKVRPFVDKIPIHGGYIVSQCWSFQPQRF